MHNETKSHIFDHINKDKLERMLEIKGAYEKNTISLEEAKKRMKEEVGPITPDEFAASEQLLKDHDEDECRNENVRTMLDLFENLISLERPELPFGHPIDAYLRENDRAKELLEEGDKLLGQNFILNPWLEILEPLLEYKIHFSRKQNQLYSALEEKGFDRPTTTMWTYDDYIRDEMNEAIRLLHEGKDKSFLCTYKELATDLRDLMSKEELILYPTALKLISEEEFENMKSGDREIGFFQIDMPLLEKNITGNTSTAQSFAQELSTLLSKYGFGTKGKDDILDVAEGKLTLEQINLLFQNLPVDISFVDENELVRFYSDTKHRVFPRSKGVIGRKVNNCHPPKSVHIVEEIIDKFRRGEQDKAEFWINKPDLFIYIVYVAIRDEQKRFRGVMEMMQDCTHIRNLEGSRTLLTWDEEESKTKAINKEQSSPRKESRNEGVSIHEETKLKTLLEQYPQLLNDLVQISPKFKMLQTPMAKVILPVATIKIMSERADIQAEELIAKLNQLIDNYNAE